MCSYKVKSNFVLILDKGWSSSAYFHCESAFIEAFSNNLSGVEAITFMLSTEPSVLIEKDIVTMSSKKCTCSLVFQETNFELILVQK